MGCGPSSVRNSTITLATRSAPGRLVMVDGAATSGIHEGASPQRISTSSEASLKRSVPDSVKNSGCCVSQFFTYASLTLNARGKRRLTSTVVIGGQDHFYLEGHIAVAIPQEGGAMLVHSSTQHPTEVQSIVAHALN